MIPHTRFLDTSRSIYSFAWARLTAPLVYILGVTRHVTPEWLHGPRRRLFSGSLNARYVEYIHPISWFGAYHIAYYPIPLHFPRAPGSALRFGPSAFPTEPHFSLTSMARHNWYTDWWLISVRNWIHLECLFPRETGKNPLAQNYISQALLLCLLCQLTILLLKHFLSPVRLKSP